MGRDLAATRLLEVVVIVQGVGVMDPRELGVLTHGDSDGESVPQRCHASGVGSCSTPLLYGV